MCAGCADSAAIGDTRIIRTSGRGQSDEVRRQVAAALVLKRIPSIEQIRLLLLVFEKVNDEVDDRCCCVKVAIESIPDSGDEITRPGLGRRIVTQGELNACDGIGRVLCESTQPREYRYITSWEKKLVFGHAQVRVERHVLSSDGVHRWRWRRLRLLPAGLG